MPTRDPFDWMLSEAIESLTRAERLQKRLFSLQPSAGPAWEPPIDVLETDRELLIFVALPGVDPDHVIAAIDNDTLIITGQRILPAELQDALIRRLELPQGRFERRIALPVGRYAVSRYASNGCVVLRLSKSA
ncbi:Hsp20/alpha crystallin family protein [Bradyrhizobium lablabi]|uniref:Hsp20/alpha crystallin family protein n=1 Tax=Bradyrhizobium lablabi TaxID=722472 RepID=UPI001BA46C80|nr:Hsp20/alpha crystallin family protein [Bradyrhizobium lablabi]MBR0693957.1 Hsp20/alpha crystallin family protein [Bradyrhizobium lablabi]